MSAGQGSANGSARCLWGGRLGAPTLPAPRTSPEPGMSGHFSSGRLQSDTSWDTTALGTQGRALFSALQQTSTELLHLPAQSLAPARKRGQERPKSFPSHPFFASLCSSCEVSGAFPQSICSHQQTTGRRDQSQLCPPSLHSQPFPVEPSAKHWECGLPMPSLWSLGFTPSIKHPREIPAKLELLPS